MRFWKIAAVATGVVPCIASCGSSTPVQPELPTVAMVTFSYHSPVAPGQPPSDPENVTGCVHHYSAMGGSFVLSGSWSPDTLYRDFQGDCLQSCKFSIAGVPTDREHVVRMWDLGMCNVNATQPPLSFVNITADGVALSRVVDHPSGLRGVAFTLLADGSVTP